MSGLNDDVVGRTPLTLARPCGRNAGRLPGPDHPLRRKRNFDFLPAPHSLSLRSFPISRFAVFSHHPLAPDAPPPVHPSSSHILSIAHHPSIAATSRTASPSPRPRLLSTTHDELTGSVGDERLAPVAHLRPRITFSVPIPLVLLALTIPAITLTSRSWESAAQFLGPHKFHTPRSPAHLARSPVFAFQTRPGTTRTGRVPGVPRGRAVSQDASLFSIRTAKSDAVTARAQENRRRGHQLP